MKQEPYGATRLQLLIYVCHLKKRARSLGVGWQKN